MLVTTMAQDTALQYFLLERSIEIGEAHSGWANHIFVREPAT